MITDATPMPFGKYKGVSMANVPAEYLLWLYERLKPSAPNKRSASEKLLVDYIEDNMDVLKKETR